MHLPLGYRPAKASTILSFWTRLAGNSALASAITRDKANALTIAA